MSRRTFAIGAGAAGLAGRARAASGPIDEGFWADINGLPQWITIRGRNPKNPVLVWLHGGPGIAMSSAAPAFFDWEADFTIVQWDQPGSGATAVRTPDQGPLTLDRYVTDGLAVVELARKRLKVRKVVLMGISWGTELGLEMIQRRPDLFSAYVGTAQVLGARGFKVGYELALEASRKRGDAKAVAALEKLGPPPYASFDEFMVRQTYTNPPGQPMSPAEQAANAALAKLMAVPVPDARYNAYKTVPAGFDGGANFMAIQRIAFARLFKWEARDLGRTYKVPVFVFQGENDFNAPAVLAREFVDEIQAPAKAFEIIPGAGHNTVAFHDQLLALLKKHVLPRVRRA